MRKLKRFEHILIIVIFLGGIYGLSKSPRYQWTGKLIYRVETDKKIVALTFDDGPSDKNTEEVLAMLKEFSVSATFFMIGENIQKYPALAKKVFLEGHQIANHTLTHQRTLFSSVDFFMEEITKTDDLIKDLGFTEQIVFRPPFAKKLINLPLALEKLGKVSVTWDADSEDTKTQDVKILVDNVLSQIKPGSIILFHDGFARKDGTLSAAREVITQLKNQGYEFVTVNELIGGIIK